MQTLNILKSTRPRRKSDFYPTPPELAMASMKKFLGDEYLTKGINALDPGCGDGVWGKVFNELGLGTTTGVDINFSETAKSIYDKYYIENFLDFSGSGFDLVYGNPPFSLAQEFVEKSFDIIKNGGYIFFFFRLAFLESQRRYKSMFTTYMIPKRVYVMVRRPCFFRVNGKRGTNAISYAMFLWKKGYKDTTLLDWINWEYDG